MIAPNDNQRNIELRLGNPSSPSTFTRFLDNPLFGNHAPLVWGWSVDQLTPIADRLAQMLPAHLTKPMHLAMASCVRSLVVEKVCTGGGVRYARAKDPYQVPARYRRDPSQSCYFVTRSMDTLDELGLIHQALGLWCPGARGSQSVAWATDDLMQLLGPLVDVGQVRAFPSREESIVLRDRDDKKQIDYIDTAATIAMRQEVEIINEALARVQLHHGQGQVHILAGRRIFNGSFDRGGRFYIHGPSFQNMPAVQRRELEVVIDGVAHPMVEVDYANLHIEMAYRGAGKRLRTGDQYAIEGFDRALVKVAVNTVFNARTEHAGVLAVSKALYDGELGAIKGIEGGTRRECRNLAKRVVTAIKQKHRRIARYFGSDCGARFQRRDSDIAVQIMLRMIRRTGRCPLPVHDSFLVADIDEEVLVKTMREVALGHKIHPTLKVLRPGEPATSLSYMEVTTSELHKQALLPAAERKHWGAEFTVLASCADHLRRSKGAGLIYGHDPPAITQRRPAAQGRGPTEISQTPRPKV